MKNISQLSKRQVLYRYFEKAVNTTDLCSIRTEKILQTTEYENPEISKSLSLEIGTLLKKKNEHFKILAQRQNEFFQLKKEKDSTEEESEVDDYSIIDSQLKELLGEVPETITESSAALEDEDYHIHPSLIELKEITSESTLKTQVFPLSFRCNFCGHYEILDPETTENTNCPCCASYCVNCKKQISDKNVKTCPQCNQKLIKNQMEQFPYVFACPRCTEVHELVPPKIKVENIRGSLIECPNCNNGHLHFFKTESISGSFWFCSDRNCDYKTRLFKNCVCHVYSSDEEKSISSIMKPSLSSSSLYIPLIKSFLFLGNRIVNLEELEKQNEKMKDLDMYYWKLSDELEDLNKKMILDLFSISDIFSIPEITTISSIYGYKSGTSSYPIIIPEVDKLADIFVHGRNKYRAYVIITKGRGLVFKFDKQRIEEFINYQNNYEESKSYQEIVSTEIEYINQENFQDVLDNYKGNGLAPLLHSLEHSLFSSITNQIGMEIFGSKILLEDCAIILYELEDVSSGGLVQLTYGKQGGEMKKMLRNFSKQISFCRQMCKSACPACIFIEDFYCHPFMPNEISRWLPSNSLLDRCFSKSFMEYSFENMESGS